MKNLKKLLAVIVMLAMVASFTVPAFAEDTAATTATKTDAQICTDLGVLKGDGGGVTADYLKKDTNRIQAATLYLRLIGKEADAKAFTGTDTFQDANLVKYADGKAILAYLKANPDLGWVGDGKKFNPLGLVTDQMLYKVMLVSLGYTEGEGKDFKYADTITFADGKGLKAKAGDTSINNEDTAAILVETLKTKVKDQSKTLLDELIAKNVVKEADAISAGLKANAAMTAVSAIDATTITVSFDKAVTANAADYKVADSSSKDLAVSSATLADAGKTVVLKVAEMTIGSKYTVTYGGVSNDVVPTIKDDTSKPALDSAIALTGAMVRATFATRNINTDTIVAANFTLDNGATVTGATLDTITMAKEGQENNTVVLLNVTGIKQGKAFAVTSSKIASYEGAVASSSSATFAGKDPDTTAPSVAGAASEAGYQVIVTFDEAGIIDATGLDIANYSISPTLTITAAKWKYNELGNNVVVLTTSDQKSGTGYTLTVNNLSDGTNKMTSAKTAMFAGKDKAKNQKLVGAVANDATKVEVTFEYEANDTALAIANYSMDRDIKVTAAEFKEDTSSADKLDHKKVILTTSAMKSGLGYTLTVGTGVQDILGQGLSAAASSTFAGKDPDTSFGSVSAKSGGKNSVTITFGEAVDRKSATNLANYYISDLGYPSAVTLNAAGDKATLKVADQSSSKSYTVTFNNIKDKAGNVITANTKATFTGIGDPVTDIKLVSADAISEKVIKVVFNQKLQDKGAAGTINFKLTLNDGTTITGLTAPTVNITAGATPSEKFYITLSGATMNSSSVYKLTVDSLTNLEGYLTKHSLTSTAGDKEKSFVGSSAKEATFGIQMIEAIDKKHIKITFNDAMDTAGNAFDTTLNIFSNSGYSDIAKNASNAPISAVNYDVTPANVVTDSNKAVIYTLANAMDNNSIYYVEFTRANFKNTDGLLLAPYEDGKSTARIQLVTGSLADSAKLDIASAVMYDKNTIQVKFNVDTNKPAIGTLLAKIYLVKKDATASTSASTAGISIVNGEWVDSKTLNVYFTGEDKLDEANSMAYIVIDSSSIKSFTDNTIGFDTDKNFEFFAKNTTDNAKPVVTAAEAVANNVIKVTMTERIYNGTTQTPLVATGADDDLFVLYNKDTGKNIVDTNYSITLGTGDEANKVFYITLVGGSFLSGANYQIGLADGVYGIDGIVKADKYDPSVDSTKNSVNFGGIATTTISAPIAADLAKLKIEKGSTDYQVATATGLTGINAVVEVTLDNGTTWIKVGSTDGSGALTPTANAITAGYTVGKTPKYRYIDTSGNISAASEADGAVLAIRAVTLTNAGGASTTAFDGASDVLTVTFWDGTTVKNVDIGAVLANTDFIVTGGGTIVAAATYTPAAAATNNASIVITWGTGCTVTVATDTVALTATGQGKITDNAGGNVVLSTGVAVN